MRSAIVRTCASLAREGVDLHFLTADLGFKVLDPFREPFPERFTNAGVAESNMISVAAGLAMTGKRPICYSMVPFLFFRAFEHVRLDVVAPRLPVVLVGVGGGLSYGHEGMSHHAIEDVAIARSLPGLTVLCPGDPVEAEAALRYAMHLDGPSFIRLGQNNDPVLHQEAPADIRLPLPIRRGRGEVVVFALGHMLATVTEAAASLQEQGVSVDVFSLPCVKPFPVESVRQLTTKAKVVVTVEEHSVIGGLGTAMLEALHGSSYSGRFVKIGLPDEYCTTHGTPKWLRTHYGIGAADIAARIKELAS